MENGPSYILSSKAPPPTPNAEYRNATQQCLGAMVKAGLPVAGGSKNKCPLCRIEFSQEDVVSGAELEKAGGASQAAGGEEEAAGAVAAAEAAVPGATAVEGKGGGRVPPPKVAALLQR